MADKNDNVRLIETFYTAFKSRDPAGIASCYTSDAEFSDPVFPGLRGPEVTAMWRMLCARAKSLEITFRDAQADDQRGSVHWEAVYPFSATGRMVHNVIEGRFEFRDGKIQVHQDHFDLWRWTRMALGLKGVLLGWAPPVQAALRKKARAGLDDFMRGGG